MAAVAIVTAICAVVVKKQVPEVGLVLALCAGAIILSFALDSMSSVTGLMEALSDSAGLSPAVLSPVVKTVGIAIITRISAEVCRDAKEGGLAAFVETAGAALALVVCVPLMKSVLSMLERLL